MLFPTLLLIIGVVVVTMLIVKKVKITWYEWLLGVIGWALAYFAAQNYSASILEVEPRAAGYLLLILGVPALIFLGLAWFLSSKRLKA